MKGGRVRKELLSDIPWPDILWLEGVNIFLKYTFHNIDKSQPVDSMTTLALQASGLFWTVEAVDYRFV